MTAPLSLDVILNKLPPDDEMWVLQDKETQRYVVIPDDRFPGRWPIRFFMKRDDAQAILEKVVEANAKLKGKEIIPVRVKLRRALAGIAAEKDPEKADAFVIHSPNEVFEYLWNGS